MKVQGVRSSSVSFSDPVVGREVETACILENLLHHYFATGVLRKHRNPRIHDMMLRSIPMYGIRPAPEIGRGHTGPLWMWSMDMDLID